MFTIKQLQSEILKLKAEKGICVLAHSYMAKEITEVADFTGDSFQLSVMAQKSQANSVIMCGVRFMAETVKILSPQKKVWLANPDAGCPMAEQMDKELIEGVKEMFPGYAVVAYINTTAELKTVCDVCVTSSSAVKIIEKLPQKNILFIPDCNLGAYVAKMVPQKNIKLLQGGCPIHAAVTAKDVKKAKAAHPNAKILVHPECVPSVVELADFVGSTSEILKFAQNGECGEYIIGTEISIAEHLQYFCPNKRFYYLSQKLLCPNMKSVTLMDLFHCINGNGGEEILLPGETVSKAKICIDKMLELG